MPEPVPAEVQRCLLSSPSALITEGHQITEPHWTLYICSGHICEFRCCTMVLDILVTLVSKTPFFLKLNFHYEVVTQNTLEARAYIK